ncbi:MAG: DNA polymerase III subunit alpha, partial [Anaerolineales bacterium]|nr:DNA polymerase III subunit alpha [Anaerolineales bacterium]
MYVELHCHSNFSLLDGASHPEELVEQAAALGMSALALTDHDAVYGVPRFIQAAERVDIKPLVGAELTFEDGHHLTLLVENQAGWHNLCYLISRGRHQAEKGEAALPFEELVGCTEGLIALSGCRHGHLAAALLANRRGVALQWARRYRRLFGDDHFFIELQHHQRPDDQFLVTCLVNLASYLQLPIVATNNVHYATQDRYQLQNVLVAIRHNQPLSAVHAQQYPNSEYYLKTAADLCPFFPREALTNTAVIAERCYFELAYGLQDLPIYPTPHGMSSGAYLRRLCLQALSQRYGDKGTETARAHLDHELNIIEQSGLANYFLIVWDIVRFAHEQGIRCQGRGSAAGSLVAYLLQISPIDPLAHGLVFERFLSAERSVTPDIDIDFDAARREEVIQYLYQRYGEAHTAMACTFVTFRRRSALRDVARALDLSPETVAAATAHLDDATNSANQDNSQITQLLALCEQIQGFPRHLGIHNGGMIITASPLMGRMPTEPATMAARTVVQWDKEGLEQAGLVKIDVLGLRMLSAIDEAVRLVAEERGRQGEGEKGGQGEVLPRTFDDPAVYEM